MAQLSFTYMSDARPTLFGFDLWQTSIEISCLESLGNFFMIINNDKILSRDDIDKQRII